MCVFEIKAENYHWLDNHDNNEDLCLHASVYVKIGNENLEYDCTVSATALYFLRSLTENHIIGTDNQMLPCCGHSLFANDDLSEVTIVGCSNGVDWNIYHQDDIIKLVLENGYEVTIPLDEYQEIVYQFVDEVEMFYRTSEPRIMPDDDIDRDGYIAFWNEWHDRRGENKNDK